MKKIINKKNLILLSLLLLLPLFVGCNGTPPINHAPNITSTPINVATVETLYTYDVNATDSDADILTYALTVNPLGMTINSSTGVISWTPTSAQVGDNPVTVEVSDGEFQDTQTFVITVQLTAGVLTSITVLPATMTLSVGESRTITSITASYDAGPDATIALNNPGCVYSSNNISVATVAVGVVTGVAAGPATITISYTEGAITRTDTIGITVSMTVKPVHNITQSIYYATIQAALNAANSGDTIEAANGVYNESITFPSGRLVILRSVNGSLYTFIKGIDGSDTVTCNGSLKGTKLQGFTITHQMGANGTGVSNNNGTLTIAECSISGNSAPQPGGGIRNYHGTLNITGSNISGNSAITSGGGILNDNGTLTIIGNSIISNNTTDYGGGICNYHGTSTVTGGSTISENFAALHGGGIINDHGTVTVTGGSIVSENSTDNMGGGIYNDDGALTITGSTISENSASASGGGIFNNHGILTVTAGSTISENTASYCGGGIYNDDGALTITGSTISENSAFGSWCGGGGINSYNGTFTIGGSSIADTAHFNNFINNKLGNTVSSAQHIRGNSGDIHGDFPNNYYTPN